MMHTTFALCAIAALLVTGASAQGDYNLPSASVTMTVAGTGTDCASVTMAIESDYEAQGFVVKKIGCVEAASARRRLMAGTFNISAIIQQTPTSPTINALLQAANNGDICKVILCTALQAAGGDVTGSSAQSSTPNALPTAGDVTVNVRPFVRSVKRDFDGAISDNTALTYYVTAGPSYGSVRVSGESFTYFVRFFVRNDKFDYVATSQAGLFSNTAKVTIKRQSWICGLLNIGCKP